ncbi:SseB family protein [Sedimentitalea sp. JM2-8]|uniref:SseB family protein n=1 Tax=Sedimentitalea xiamensis TaxID=3050037 RepID=A0ABT7FB35_9RHOB|nr:SseB family protein [Sedimentitalea xiamensis]MDK3072323.1 SseB family protein [Sedimentitalea xiamensis]
MTETTALDRAHAAMAAADGDDAARLRFFERLGDCELFLLLTEEPEGDNLSPEVFDVAEGRFVLGFDLETRLAQFAGRPAPYAALSGRVAARMLAAQGLGLGLNLDVAPSSILIPADAVAWLAQTLEHAPDEVETRIESIHAPGGLPKALLEALDAKLATAAGLAQAAYLVGVSHGDQGRGHLLGFVGARAGAERALAKAAGEALTFSGIDAGAMDVGFFAATDPMVVKLAAHGLRFDLPQPAPTEPAAPAAPGRDPDRPPILR